MKTTIEKLNEFVNQRAGLNFADYGDVSSYRKESREITRDRSDYYELLGFARMTVNDLEQKLETELKETSGRLKMDKEGNIEYCTGQYFPTEYRPAACRVLSWLIWKELGKVYETGNDIRKAARRNVSRRVCKFYFN